MNKKRKRKTQINFKAEESLKNKENVINMTRNKK